MGTVNVSSVGVIGKEGVAWAIPVSPWPLNLTIGTFSKKIVLESERLSEIDVLHITVSLDHDVVDGAPAARALRYFADIFKAGYGLEEFDIPASQKTLLMNKNRDVETV